MDLGRDKACLVSTKMDLGRDKACLVSTKMENTYTTLRINTIANKENKTAGAKALTIGLNP